MADTAVAPEIKDLGDKIAKLTIIQAVALKDYLKQEYKIEPAAGGVAMAAAGPAGPAAALEKAAEPTEFNVILEPGFEPAKKIGIIKVVREIAGLGLGRGQGVRGRRSETGQGRAWTRPPPRRSRSSWRMPLPK